MNSLWVIFFFSVQTIPSVDVSQTLGFDVYLDSVMDALADESQQLESVLRHSDVVKGYGHMTNASEEAVRVSANLSPLLSPSDSKIHHKSNPPVIGSLCDHEEYSKLYSRYFNLPFLKHEDRLYEHKNIEQTLKQGNIAKSSEFAWSICQFGGTPLECSETRRCQCLYKNPPFRYVKRQWKRKGVDTCVGKVGSICTNDTRATIVCIEGFNCTDGYCGGLRLAARILTATTDQGVQYSPVTSFYHFILIISSLGELFN